MARLKRLLVANRGEIAVRIIRAAYDEGIEAVLAVSEADRGSLGAQLADRVVCIGPASPAESYLDINRVVAAATTTGCDALHPGYGFVSESPELAAECEEAGIVFVGPSADAMRRAGDKARARELAAELGVPTNAGSGVVATEDEARAEAERLGYPVLLKATAGGGGRGMRLVEGEGDLAGAFSAASSEAGQAFGDSSLFVERYIRHARHIEVQVLADGHGNVIHLGLRDCTVQRRYQKLIEESPPEGLPDEHAELIASSATRVIGALSYQGAATCEYLVDVDRGTAGFLEINARLQVEHPVTEMVTGIDIVREQLRIAAGEPLSVAQEEVAVDGHSIEARINSERPASDFMPSPGTLERWAAPVGSDVRVDTACFPGWTVAPFYDSLLAKVITWGPDRERARARMLHALRHLVVRGVDTTAGFLRDVLEHEDVIANSVHTRWLEEEFMPHWAGAEMEPA